MPTPQGARHPALARGTRLLHIGMPKTGTTALQTVAAGQRDELLARGVRYPGTETNHRRALLAKLGMVWGWGEGSAVPSMRHWDALEAEIAAETEATVWFGHEFCATAGRAAAQGLVDAVGGAAHVVVTFRNIAAYLPSAWQQYLKSGLAVDFESWLHTALDDWPAGGELTASFGRRIDYAGIVKRWARVVGAENLTVIVLDPQDRSRVSETFEDLLGLPRTMLDTDSRTDSFSQNRGFSREEAEVLLRVNQAIERGGGLPWADYTGTVRTGTVDRLLNHHVTGAGEHKLLPPEWAVARANEIARGQLERISGSGATIVGDLELLASATPSAQAIRPAEIPADIVEDALAGAVSAGSGRGWDFAEPEPPVMPTVRRATADYRTRELGREILRRARYAARQRVRAIAGRAQDEHATAESDPS